MANEINGQRVLVVEDRFLLADDLGRILESLGFQVVGPVSSVDGAMQAVSSEKIDAALLDIDLQGAMTFEVADLLQERGVPYVFWTGFDHAALPEQYRERPFLAKPLTRSGIKRALTGLLDGRAQAV